MPLLNLIIFIYWFPLLVCLASVRFNDIAQLVPIILQLVFLTSPILYRKESLGDLNWITNFNFIYKVIEPIRMSLIDGYIIFTDVFLLLIINVVGLILTIYYLHSERKRLPFMV